MNRHFFLENMQIANRHLKKTLIILIWTTQIQTTVRYHLTPVRMPLNKKQKTSVDNDMGKLELFHTVGGIKHCADAMENSMKVPSNIKKYALSYDQQSHLWTFIQKNWN